MTLPISALDVPASVVSANALLTAALASPPVGHTPALQPAAWYERVFDLMACAHPEACSCEPGEGR